METTDNQHEEVSDDDDDADTDEDGADGNYDDEPEELRKPLPEVRQGKLTFLLSASTRHLWP